MNKISLIGNTGFIGKNLIELNMFEFTQFFNSKNIQTISEFEHDIIICAAPSAEKWKANKFPEEDLKSIMNLINSINFIKNKEKIKFILFSTIDIYGKNVDEVDETCKPCIDAHDYGYNRYILENYIVNNFPDHMVFRLPGLFGKHLKKNIIFDLLNKKEIKINSLNQFQWFQISDIVDVYKFSISKKIKILNVAIEPISNLELIEIFGLNINFDNSSSVVKYNMKTIYETNKNYLYNKEETKEKLRTFITEYK